MLRGYIVKKTENIYLEDLPLLKDPAWSVRELEHINFDRDRLHPSCQVHEWISSFIATHYASGLSFSWRHFLDDIKNGRAVMVRDSFYGPELCSVMASKDKARSDLPLILRQRVTYVLTKNVKRPISSLGPLQALIESPMFPPALRENRPESSAPIRDGVFIWTETVGATTVFDVTSDFKKQYPNINQQERQEGGRRNAVYEAGAESAAALGSLSDKSGGTVGGVLGSSYNVE